MPRELRDTPRLAPEGRELRRDGPRVRQDAAPRAVRERAEARIRRPDASPVPRAVVERRPEDRDRWTPAHTTRDHRWARPHPHYVYPIAGYVPHAWYYDPWYTHWWVHPYYRWHHATGVIVGFGWAAYPWYDGWAPPVRYGWAWTPGYYYETDWYVPGYFTPTQPAPVVGDAEYEFVPGWWIGDVYVEGFWRLAERDGWDWVEGRYLPDGTYAWGYWRPERDGPEGYVWEPGVWDGEAWVEGYWRPAGRDGFRWVSASFGADGVFRAGYWEPLEQRRGYVWIPGWFDGTEWIEGYWVPEAEYDKADPDDWEPPEGWDAGRNRPVNPVERDEPPLALPVEGTS